MRSRLCRNARSVATLVILALTWNAFALAAKPSSHLALLLAGMQPLHAAHVSLGGALPQQQPPSATPAVPVHDRMLAAHTVFLAQNGVDKYFAASATDTYNAVLNALTQWGRYQVVSDASQADLVIQLHGIATAYTEATTDPNVAPSVGYSYSLELTVVDPHTLSPLSKVNVAVVQAVREKSRVANIEVAGQNAVSRLKVIAGDPLTSKDRAGLKTIRTANHRAIVFAAVGITLGLALFFIAKHVAQNNSASFCKEHNLSPCPGA